MTVMIDNIVSSLSHLLEPLDEPLEVQLRHPDGGGRGEVGGGRVVSVGAPACEHHALYTLVVSP